MLKIAFVAIVGLTPMALVAQIKGAASNPAAGMHSGAAGEGATRGSTSGTSADDSATSGADQEALHRKSRRLDLEQGKRNSVHEDTAVDGKTIPR